MREAMLDYLDNEIARARVDMKQYTNLLELGSDLAEIHLQTLRGLETRMVKLVRMRGDVDRGKA